MAPRTTLLGAIMLAGSTLAGCDVKRADNAESSSAASAEQAPEQAPSSPVTPARGEPANSLGDADSLNGDFRLTVTEAVRSGGVLTIKARVTLIDGETGNRRLLHDFDTPDLYVGAGDQKYMVLKDNQGEPLTTADGYNTSFSQLGDFSNWWGKFPSPPPDVKTVTLYFKYFQPVENIPITDR